jgi:hypothetical protein
MKFFVKTTKHLAAVAVVTLLALPAAAETIFYADIDGASSGTPSPGAGTATLTLNDAETEVSYVISYAGMLGTEVAAHFHNGLPGVNGPVIHGLPAGQPKAGVWPVGPTEVGLLFAGQVYVNIHTTLYPGGEIRGDIAFQTVADEAESWGSVKALFR